MKEAIFVTDFMIMAMKDRFYRFFLLFLLIVSMPGFPVHGAIASSDRITDGRTTGNADSIAPLVTTTWDEGCFYNASCPPDTSAHGSCLHAYAGSGAVAMAQIMKYWQWPAHGLGEHGYTHPIYGNLYVNFSAANYNYTLMPANLSAANDEVAKLIYHCGVAQEMDYGPSGSSSIMNMIDSAFRYYFSYSANTRWKYKAAHPANWDSLLRSELDAGRPLLYYGTDSTGNDRRFFIIDGYQGSNHYHVNWCRGGNNDGYYYLDQLTQGSHHYNYNQAAIFGLVPNSSPTPTPFTMDFESSPDFSLTFDPWKVRDIDSSATYSIANYNFPHMGQPMAFIAFNPASTTPPMTDQSIQPHGGNRFGGCFSATTPPNNDWFISPKIQLGTNWEFSFWVKSYTNRYNPEKYRVAISTTTNNPSAFIYISGAVPVIADTIWTKKTFNLSAYNGQSVYVAIQCVSNDAFIFMIDDLSVMAPDTSHALPSSMSLDFESLTDFTLNFTPWTLNDVGGGVTYGIQGIIFPHSTEAMAFICFNPSQTSPPTGNMTAHGGQKFGACFSSQPPHNPNNKWLISPQMKLNANAKIAFWVQSHNPQYGYEKFNICVSTTGKNPSDFTVISGSKPDSAPIDWTRKVYDLGNWINQQVYIGIQCVTNNGFIFMIDDIEIGSSVGVAEALQPESILIYPNPASNFLWIEPGKDPEPIEEITLYNSGGFAVLKINHPAINTGMVRIDVSGLSGGLYFLTVREKAKILTKKVIIKP